MDAENLAGKVMVVTGATSGIGEAAVLELARRGAAVIGVGRNQARCEAVLQKVKQGSPEAEVSFELADLSSLGQVQALGARLMDHLEADHGGKLDVLAHSAGMVANWYTSTEDGYEMQFTVNHLAPFLLTYELLPALKQAKAGRLLIVSSHSHRNARIHWKDVMLRRRYNTLRAYKQSKLANVLFAAEFNRRVSDGTRMQAYAVDPGLVKTEIGLKGTSGIVRWIWAWRMQKGMSPAEGATTLVHLASEPEITAQDEVYWRDCQPKPPSPYALNPEEGGRLWALSERLCGINFA